MTYFRHVPKGLLDFFFFFNIVENAEHVRLCLGKALVNFDDQKSLMDASRTRCWDQIIEVIYTITGQTSAVYDHVVRIKSIGHVQYLDDLEDVTCSLLSDYLKNLGEYFREP